MATENGHPTGAGNGLKIIFGLEETGHFSFHLDRIVSKQTKR